MTNEKSKLVKHNKRNGSAEPYNVLDPAGDSFVHPRTKEHKMFIGFLVIMIICLIGLSVMMIYQPSSIDAEKKELAKDNLAADMSLKFLNSLYHEKSPMESGCESTLLLMRHCEKNDDGVGDQGGNRYCSWLGRERSYFMPSLFDPENPHRRWPVPSKIFALAAERDDSNHSTFREVETVMPLAKKFNLSIDVYPFEAEKHLAADYFELLQTGDMCGKLTVVSWKHEQIPDLAEALGCGPNEGCPADYPYETFDEVWQLKYVFDPEGKAKMSQDPMDLPVETQVPLTLTDYLPLIDDDDDDDDQTAAGPSNRQLRRMLKKHKKKRRKKWIVYGTKTYQYFDPLQFSLKSGDYPPGGSPSGGKWADEI